ncbi:S1 family serine peptidase, partial [Salmonella enterica subsp. enterica serovar Paratyphi A]
MKQFALLLVFAAAAIASPYRPYSGVDWSTIKFRTPKVPPHTLQLLNREEPEVKYEIPSDAKSFRAACGNGNRVNNRIVGGEEAVPNAWPWQVGLFIDGLYFCGGSLISDTVILTAAHCTDDATFFRVVLGGHEINNGNEAGRVEVRSEDYTQHESYNAFTIANDIAVIRLPEPITFTDTISPVCLPGADDVANDFLGEIVTPTGWGRPSDSTNSISPVLRQVDVPVMSNAICDAVYGIVTDKQICIDSA